MRLMKYMHDCSTLLFTQIMLNVTPEREQIRLGYKKGKEEKREEAEARVRKKEVGGGRSEEIGNLEEVSLSLPPRRDAFLVSSVPSPFSEEYRG